MTNAAALLLIILTSTGETAGERGILSGVVVDGSSRTEPLVGIKVVLCLDQAGERVPVESTTTDALGQFRFDDLPLGEEFTYSAGANRGGIHYPGPPVRLTPSTPEARVKLLAYDTASDDCPLRVRQHDISVRTENETLIVSESLVITNPSQRTYVGKSVNDMPPVTLRLSIPDDFEKVTFQQEFFGRQFIVVDGRVLSSLPWPPGERKLEFKYTLPIEQRCRLIKRTLDLPTAGLSVRIDDNTKCTKCNLTGEEASASGGLVTSATGENLPAGHILELQVGELPVPIMSYAKWGALAVLGALVLIASLLMRGRRPKASEPASGESANPTAVPGRPHVPLFAAKSKAKARR